MISLQNNLSNNLNISLNQYIYNSINIFKYDIQELHEYIQKKCYENPLILIDESKTPIPDISINHNGAKTLLEEMLTHFKCALNERDFYTMKFIIYSLDSKGFLSIMPEEIHYYTNDSISNVIKLIHLLKEYNNEGIGSSNVIDYLEFQLNTHNYYSEKYFNLFKHHLEDISNNNLEFLNNYPEICHIEFLSYIEWIKDNCFLSPLTGEEMPTVYPDASILFINHSLQIQVHDYLINDIKYEPIIFKTMDSHFDKEIEKYKAQYEELLSLLNARKIYLTQILSIILEVQYDFLVKDIDYLHALDQTYLAEKTGLSHATVSGIICGKYIYTPRGLLPIKSLLSKKCAKGRSVSYVKYLIKNISDFESISDNMIPDFITS